MNGREFMRALLDGKKVRRRAWSPGQYIWLNDDGQIAYADGALLRWWSSTPGSGDWEIYDERPPLDGSFESARKALLAGHAVARPGRVVTWRPPWSRPWSLSFSLEDLAATDWRYADEQEMSQ